MSKRTIEIKEEAYNDITEIIDIYGMTRANATSRLIAIGVAVVKENGFNFEGK